jgi:hypothetical protein
MFAMVCKLGIVRDYADAVMWFRFDQIDTIGLTGATVCITCLDKRTEEIRWSTDKRAKAFHQEALDAWQQWAVEELGGAASDKGGHLLE